MSTTKKSYSLVTALLFVLAIGLLICSTVGSTRAALSLQSDILDSNFGMLNIGIGMNVSGDALLQGMLGSDSKLLPGKEYSTPVNISNTGKIDEYVRVTVYKYWLNSSGTKDTRFDPDLIELGVAGGWKKDTTIPSTYGEREVYYYTGKPLSKSGTVGFLNTVKINDKIMRLATQSTSGNVITTTYVYDGAQFCIEIVADGVQAHNAKAAIRSAWGKNVTVSDGGPITGGIG